MNFLHDLVCVHTSNLLSSVPIPKTFGGIFHLGFKDILGLTVFSAITTAVGYSVYTTCMVHLGKKKSLVNLDVNKHVNKCVDIVDIESITDKKCFCRCWRSSKFPYCDGSHCKHNEETGDNVGPLIIEPKKTN
ncbi:CDGSH iron-sulfur domain-containing protein 2 A [Clonorchis sinensis]|uniref:CDGSH iron-sulfur domain-containing protein 2 homologue n=1 Tax=Clonorchis sinensis TaxID=79923 RepID=A0A8T1MZV2_CLOSI|nr:CDGSH iron-sulfur domain-containing protein 2 A [Clonorchis sinensis]